MLIATVARRRRGSITPTLGSREITRSSTAARTIGTVTATGLVSGSRVVETTLYVPSNSSGVSDYDVSYVQVLVTYTVLV